jgi:hypothetical protein
MMGAATHFLIGMLCGAAIAAVAVAYRRRWVVWLPPFVLACGFWAEAPYLLGFGSTTHWAANIFFGYAWLHPWLEGREFASFIFLLLMANLLLLGYAVFLVRYFLALDMVRWERRGPEESRGRSKRKSATAGSPSRGHGRTSRPWHNQQEEE